MRRLLRAALDAINASALLKGEDVLRLCDMHFLTTRYKSIIFVSTRRACGAPQGIVIKLPLSAEYANRWNVHAEAQRLARLQERGPRDERFAYIAPIIASDDPPFIVLSYFPAGTVKQLLYQASRGNDDVLTQRAVNACRRTGEWLGEAYSCSKQIPVNRDQEFLDFRTWVDTLQQRSLLAPMAGDALMAQVVSRLNAAEAPTAPEQLHGDFVMDNVLVDEQGRICVIDPGAARVDGCDEYWQFYSRLVVHGVAARENERAFAKWWRCTEAFNQGVICSADDRSPLAYAVLRGVLSMVAGYAKESPRQRVRANMRELVRGRRRGRIMAHWREWLSRVPPDADRLWEHVTAAIHPLSFNDCDSHNIATVDKPVESGEQ